MKAHRPGWRSSAVAQCVIAIVLTSFLAPPAHAEAPSEPSATPYEFSLSGMLTNKVEFSTMVIKNADLLDVTPIRATACGSSIASASPYDWIGHRVDHLDVAIPYSTFECQYRESNLIKVASLRLTQRGKNVVVSYGPFFFYVRCIAGTHPVTGETIESATEMAKQMIGVIDCHGTASKNLTPVPTTDYASEIQGMGSENYGIQDPVFRVTPSVSRTTRMRATLSVTGYAEAEGLDDFPIPVRISEARVPGFSYEHGLTQGRDFRFFSADGQTEYPCDVEHWDPTGESIVWVKLPRLEPNASFTFVWDGDASPVSSTNVWQGYAGVWHMDEASGNVADATGHGLTAEPYWTSTSKGYSGSVAGEGPIGNSRRISIINKTEGARLRVAYNDNLKLDGRFTASCWVMSGLSNTNEYARLFSNKSSTGDSGWEIHGFEKDLKSFRVRANGTEVVNVTHLPSVYKTWRYLTFVYDRVNLSVYADGELIGSGTVPEGGIVPDEDKPLAIGGGGGVVGWSLDGWMDEVRILKGATTAARVKAEYLVQTNAALVSAVLTGSVEKPAEGTACVHAGHLVSGQAYRLVAQLTTADGTPVGEEKVLSESASAGELFSAEWTGLETYVAYVVTVKAKDSNETVVGEAAFAVAPKKTVYKLLNNDTTTSASFGGDDEDHPSVNNWQNVDDEADKMSVPTPGYDYLVDGKTLRTSSGTMTAARTFAGDRLTLRNNAELTSKQSGTVPVSFGDLVVEDATIRQAVDNNTLSCVWANLTIADGKSCKLTMNEGSTANRAFRLQGSLVGSGLLLLSPVENGNVAIGVGLETDMSGFDGSIEFAHQPRSAFFSSWREPRELPALVADSIKMHNGTTGRPNAYYFDDSFALVSTNRGITIAGTHNVSVKRGCTVSLRNPLYGSGTLVKTETGAFLLDTYDGTNSTLCLEADRGDWTGTLRIEGGTVELAGRKPIGAGMLDATAADAKAVVVGDALGAEGCFVGGIAQGSKVTLRWTDRTDFTTDVKALRVPLATELARSDVDFTLELPETTTPARDTLTVRRSAQGDEIVFSVGPKRGFVLIFR